MLIVAAMIEIGLTGHVLADHGVVGARRRLALRVDVRDNTRVSMSTTRRLTQIRLRSFNRRPVKWNEPGRTSDSQNGVQLGASTRVIYFTNVHFRYVFRRVALEMLAIGRRLRENSGTIFHGDQPRGPGSAHFYWYRVQVSAQAPAAVRSYSNRSFSRLRRVETRFRQVRLERIESASPSLIIR